MKKVVYNGEEYYYSNGKWLDCHFVEVPQELSRKLGKTYSSGTTIIYGQKIDETVKAKPVHHKAKKKRKKTKKNDPWEENTDALDHRIPGNFWTH